MTLSKDKDGNAGATSFLNGANKVYLPVATPVGQGAPSLKFRFDTTEIEYVDAASQHEETIIYDLMGRRVEKMDKGIYIVNGKKVIVK